MFWTLILCFSGMSLSHTLTQQYNKNANTTQSTQNCTWGKAFKFFLFTYLFSIFRYGGISSRDLTPWHCWLMRVTCKTHVFVYRKLRTNSELHFQQCANVSDKISWKLEFSTFKIEGFLQKIVISSMRIV